MKAIVAVFSKVFRGQSVASRVMQSSVLTALSYGAQQALRLGSNLILARLLYPEAFGMMALVSVFLIGLQMFSDAGISPSIMQSPRGDDQDFLNAAWTLQVIRGGLLWLATLALAHPVAWLYKEPLLAQLLPVAGVALLVAGFNPTRIETEYRHLRALRVTGLDVAAQAIGIASVVVLSWWLQSVWGLVLGSIVGALAKLVLMDLFLPGPRNRLHLHRGDTSEILHFGKWIFLSSISGFLVLQGDKAVLGAYLPLAVLGIYNIGFFIGSFPGQLADVVMSRILIPLYREAPPRDSPENARNVRRLRFLLSGTVLGLLGLFALGGPALIGLLYDARYQAAGAVVVLIACAQMAGLVGKTYDQAALAHGDSRGFFVVVTIRAVVQTLLLWLGARYYGIVGALAGQALALTVVHLPVVRLARRHQVWHPLHDALIGSCALLLAAAALWLHADQIRALAGLG
ncbi:MAG: oligosaccharide flippase family protein [Qingshengfaniella sp.]